MSDEGAHWSFQLVDGITASAGLMAAAVKSLELTLKHADDSIKGSHEATQKHTESSFGKMKESFKSFQETAFFVSENIEKAWETVSEVFEKVSEGLEYVFDVSDFRRNALLGLDAMLSTGYEANEVLEKLEGWAKNSGLAKDTFTTFGKQLLGEGFKEGELKPLLASLADIQAANQGKVEASQELLQLFGRIKATDKVNERELAQFGQLSIKPDLIYAALAKNKHESIAAATASFKGGDVGGTDAINAILGAIHSGIDKGDLLGAAGKGWADGSIPAQLTKGKDAIQGMFHVDTTKFAQAIAHVTEQLEGPGGKKFADNISAALGKAGDWLAKLDFNKVGEDLDKLADGILWAADVFGSLFSGFKAGWGDMMPAISVMGDSIGALFASDGTASSDIKSFARSIANVAGAFVLLGEFVVFTVVGLAKGIIYLAEAFAWVVGEVVGIGGKIVEGLWAGLKFGWTKMLEDFKGLVELLPASVKHVLGIASPSKVFAELGLNTMLGFTAGVDRVDVEEHLTRQLAPPDVPLRPNAVTASSLGGGSGGARSIVLQLTAPIHIDGSKDARATAEELVGEMRRVFLPELASAFDQIVIEEGG